MSLRLQLVFAIALASGCYIPGSAEEHEWTVLAHRSPNWEDQRFEDGRWVATATMSLLKHNPDSVPWEFAPDKIDGFEHSWGHEVRLRVRSRALLINYLEIGPDRVFDLIEVVEKTPRANDSFLLQSIGAPWFGRDRRSFSDGQSFGCASDDVCKQLDERLADTEARFDLRMRHGSRPGQLVLVAVEDPTCMTTNECRNPPTHEPNDICCRGRCSAPADCKGDPWGPVGGE